MANITLVNRGSYADDPSAENIYSAMGVINTNFTNLNNGKQDNPVNYAPATITFGNTNQEYDITGTTWVTSSDGTPNQASHLLADCLTALANPYDNTYLAVRELTGAASETNPLTVQFTFTGVTTFNVIKFRGRYNGSASHQVVFELYNGSTWDTFVTVAGETDYVLHSAEVLVPTTYINSGTVTGRFRHLDAGVTSHYLMLDYIIIGSGGGAGGESVQTALQTPFFPTGNIAATNVQAAIAELDSEKAAVAQTFYLGTTQIAINRASGAIALSGITSIDGNAATVTIADEAADTTCFPLFVTAATGSLGPKTHTGLIFNASTGELGSTLISAATGFVPDANDGAYLGTASLQFSDLFLASGGVINWANGNATLTHSTGLLTINVPLSIGTSNALTLGSIELGHASDTTLARVSAGVVSIEGVNIVTETATQTLTNKRVTPRVGSTTSSATPTINTDNYDAYSITALAVAITSMTTNLSGTPTNFQKLLIRIKDNGTARAITWGTSFQSGSDTLPTTTVVNKTLLVGLMYDSVDSKWTCESVKSRA